MLMNELDSRGQEITRTETRSGVARAEPHRQAAFTLIEVLLVMLIASIMMSIVVMAIPGTLGGGDDLQREAERITELLRMAGDEAVVSGVEIGFEAGRLDYRFYRYDEDIAKWAILDEQPFQERKLSENIELRLEVEGRPIELGSGSRSPAVLILSSGETTPFRLYVKALQGDSMVVSSDGFSGTTRAVTVH